MKPGNVLQYINVKSNHPPSVIKAVPKGINKRLSEISSDEQSFKNATPEYQAALKNSGFTFELKYEPQTPPNSPNPRKRTRNITWFNPPFDLQVKSNIGREFLQAINESFPEGHVLKPIFNRNTVKISYSCMPNVKNTIDSHNKQKLNADTPPTPEKPCNCRDKSDCPFEGKSCRESGVIYQATVTSNNKKETYIGLTDTPFKLRLSNHKQSFKNKEKMYATELSKYVWSLKEANIDYQIKWKLVGRATSYSNITKKCNLCLLEKFYILRHRDMASINKKTELVSCCRHKHKFLLCNA